MEISQAIFGRRAVRSYTDREVTRESIRALARAAVRAPSALNAQAWAFGVFQGHGLLADFSQRAKLHFLERFSPGSDPNGRMREALLADESYDIFHGAGTVVVIYAKPTGGHSAVGECYLAAQNFMLAAHGVGLATCPVGFAQPWLDLDEIKNELGIPVTYTAAFPLVVGYPAGEAEDPGRLEPEFLN